MRTSVAHARVDLIDIDTAALIARFVFTAWVTHDGVNVVGIDEVFNRPRLSERRKKSAAFLEDVFESLPSPSHRCVQWAILLGK